MKKLPNKVEVENLDLTRQNTTFKSKKDVLNVSKFGVTKIAESKEEVIAYDQL